MIPENSVFLVRKYALSVLEDSQTAGKRLSDGNGYECERTVSRGGSFSLDYEGQGVARVDGKTVFIGGALPGERVTFAIHKEKAVCREAPGRNGFKTSSERIEPACCYFDTCGGCSFNMFLFGRKLR